MSRSESILSTLIDQVAELLGYSYLKDLQKQAIVFFKGQRHFHLCASRLGKSLCYIMLAMLFDRLRGREYKSIALVVSLLLSLMKDVFFLYPSE